MVEKLRTLFRGEAWLLWIVMAFVFQSFQFQSEIKLVSFALLVGYAVCIFMFMHHLTIRQTQRRAELENLSMDFMRAARIAGRGKFNYFIPRMHTSRIKYWYAKVFRKTYLRVYEATFFDDGSQGFKSYKYVAVSNKQLFEMKLRGMVNTESHERAMEALDYLDVSWPIP